jgi:hypothetical protein
MLFMISEWKGRNKPPEVAGTQTWVAEIMGIPRLTENEEDIGSSPDAQTPYAPRRR